MGLDLNGARSFPKVNLWRYMSIIYLSLFTSSHTERALYTHTPAFSKLVLWLTNWLFPFFSSSSARATIAFILSIVTYLSVKGICQTLCLTYRVVVPLTDYILPHIKHKVKCFFKKNLKKNKFVCFAQKLFYLLCFFDKFNRTFVRLSTLQAWKVDNVLPGVWFSYAIICSIVLQIYYKSVTSIEIVKFSGSAA